MEFTTLKIAGVDAVRLLNQHRSRFRTTGQYPFLIGDAEDLGHITEVAEFNKVDPAAIIRAALKVNTDRWIAVRQEERESYGLVLDELLGEWPDEILIRDRSASTPMCSRERSSRRCSSDLQQSKNRGSCPRLLNTVLGTIAPKPNSTAHFIGGGSNDSVPRSRACPAMSWNAS